MTLLSAGTTRLSTFAKMGGWSQQPLELKEAKSPMIFFQSKYFLDQRNITVQGGRQLLLENLKKYSAPEIRR